MFEFHVDAHKILSENFKDKRFGGNLSVRKLTGSKILLSFGQRR